MKKWSFRDGQKTRESEPDPHVAYFCYFEKGGSSCSVPSASLLKTELPDRLAIDQILRMGGINALIGNTDAPLLKQNNYYYKFPF